MSTGVEERTTPLDQGLLSGRKRELALLVLILLSAGALHVAAVQKPFFADDYFFLEQVRGRSLPAALVAPDPLGNFLRPVSRQAYFWTVSRLGHESPVVFHLAGLLIFLMSLLVFNRFARLLGGSAVALTATALLGFSYAADVPLRWASGSQDLLALLFATAAILLHVKGRHVLGAVLLLLGLLSKETVALAAMVAIVADRRAGETWRDPLRRGAWLVGATLLWGAVWIGTSSARPAGGHALSLAPANILATLAHLVQVALGLEFRAGGSTFGHSTPVAALTGIAGAALVWLASSPPPPQKDVRDEESPSHSDPRTSEQARLIRVGVAWTLAGVLPLVVVMPIWSAYFYLFALFGVALFVAGLATAMTPVQRTAIVGGLIFLSAQARALDQFATSRGAWAWQSHVNRHYIDRALRTIEQYLEQMRTARPTLPSRSTVFFANVPVSLGWQAGDGPLLRWAYRDSSLRSYFLTQFSREKVGRGPVFFFAVEGDSLADKSASPMLLPSFAYSMLLAERPKAAIDALDMVLNAQPDNHELLYWRAWAHWGVGDSLGAASDLEQAGVRATRLLPAGTAHSAGAVTDTANRIDQLIRIRNLAGLSPWVHARLAALWLASRDHLKQGAVEAYAFRLLAADDPDAWRKWSSAQLMERQYEPALQSLERYLELAGDRGHADREAQQVLQSLRRVVRGDIAQQSLQTNP